MYKMAELVKAVKNVRKLPVEKQGKRRVGGRKKEKEMGVGKKN